MAVLLCLRKQSKVGIVHLLMAGYLIFAMFSGKYAINHSEWLYSTLRIVLMLSFITVMDIDEKTICKTMLVLGVLFVGYFWYDYSQMGSFHLSRGLMRMVNSWAIAHFLVLPFCYYAITEGFWKKFAWFIGSMMCLNIVLLNSRSAMLAVCVMSAVIFIKHKRTRLPIIGLILTLILLAFTARHGSLGNPFNTKTLHMRIEQWVPTLDMIIKNPFGVGNGNWWINFPAYAHDPDFENVYVLNMFRFPHNDFLWVWAEVGIFGFLCYVGMFVWALKGAKTYLLIGLLGYMTVANFSAVRERPFSSLMLCVFLSLACKRKWTVRPRYLVIPLLFFMVVLGFRYRSSCWNKKLMRSQSFAQIYEGTAGYSHFSQLTYSGLPYYWWKGMCSLKSRNEELAIKQLRTAYLHNPNNIQAINGMGITYGLEKKYDKAKEYFNEALEICPDFKDAEDNLKRVEFQSKKAPQFLPK
jgi:O-antigen ligase